MNHSKIKNSLFLAFPILLFVYESIHSYGKLFGVVDINREVFFPLSMLNGEVLYKDIFNIFGPFAYYFNALLYKIFGINLSTLYWAGVVNTAIILIFTYLISKKFLPKNISLAIVIFSMVCGFFPTLMNYICPYSYAIVYGYSAFLISAYCFINFLEKSYNKQLYLASLFAGLSITCKYEFIFYPLVMFVFLWIKKHKEDCLLCR